MQTTAQELTRRARWSRPCVRCSCGHGRRTPTASRQTWARGGPPSAESASQRVAATGRRSRVSGVLGGSRVRGGAGSARVACAGAAGRKGPRHTWLWGAVAAAGLQRCRTIPFPSTALMLTAALPYHPKAAALHLSMPLGKIGPLSLLPGGGEALGGNASFKRWGFLLKEALKPEGGKAHNFPVGGGGCCAGRAVSHMYSPAARDQGHGPPEAIRWDPTAPQRGGREGGPCWTSAGSIARRQPAVQPISWNARAIAGGQRPRGGGPIRRQVDAPKKPTCTASFLGGLGPWGAPDIFNRGVLFPSPNPPIPRGSHRC